MANTAGIGQGRVTGNMAADDFRPDLLFEIPDAEMMPVLQALQRDEGIAVGGSAGINVAGAIRVAQELGPGHNIVTVLCDRADRYSHKLYDQGFLESKGLPTPDWVHYGEGGGGTAGGDDDVSKALSGIMNGN